MKTTKLRVCICLFLGIFLNVSFSQTIFSDITSTAGLKGEASSPYSTNSAWGDYNNDGYLDVYLTNWGSASTAAKNILFKNRGDGTFVDVSSQTGTASRLNSTSAVWGDFDNDGDQDLYVTNYYNQDILYKNLLIESGEATFQNYTSSAGLNIVALGNEMTAVWGDYNNDGYLDIYICKFYANNELYKNNKNGTFSLVTDDAGVGDFRDSEGALWTDFNDDGWIDLYVVNREQENTFYVNNQNGTFTERGGELNTDNIELGRNALFFDYNKDGYLDLFISNIGANSLYRYNGTDFTDVSSSSGVEHTGTGWDSWDETEGDFDMDGDRDLIVVGGGDTGYETNAFFRNENGTFTDDTENSGISRGTFNGNSYATSVSSADFDNDGDLDVYIVNYGQNIFYKNSSNPSNYIKVKVQGKGSGGTNKNGIGSRIKLKEKATDTLVGFHEIRSSASPHEVIFGGIDPAKDYYLEVALPKVSFQNTPLDIITEDVTSSDVTIVEQ